jgi:hypothetical protein
MDAFSIKNAYLTCIRNQLRNALNDTGRLGKIYIGLIHYILAKFGGALNLPRLKPTDCLQSPTTRTLYLLKDVGHIYIKSSLPDFSLNPTPLETQWLEVASNQPFLLPQGSLKLLYKLLLYHITTISHITLPNGTHLMSIPDFKTYYATPTTLIKQALTVAKQLFCHPLYFPHCHNPCLLHHPLCTLLPQYVTLDHIILPRLRPHPLPLPLPSPYLPVPLPPHPYHPHYVLQNPLQFPITLILHHKHHKLLDTNHIFKKFTTYLC